MSFLKKGFVVGLVVLGMAALLVGFSIRATVEAADVKVIEVKEVPAAKIPTFDATAYIAGHGGHLAILNMKTMKAPVDIEKVRIVLSEAGSEMEGKIAGMSFEEVKKSGGSHGQALVTEKGKKVLVAGTLAGNVYKIDLATGKKEGPIKVGEKFCGAIVGPDGNVYFEDMADGNVYVFDSNTLKTVDKMPVGKAVCGIGWDKAVNRAFVTDMVQGKVFVLDWKTKKVDKTIEDVGTFLHQGRMNPDKTEYWVTAANEFKVGAKGPEPYAAAGKGKMELVIIDVKKEAVKDRIDLTTQGAFPHDMAFTPDGKYALVTARTYGDDSIMMVIDTKTHEILGEKSMCKACHEPAGVKVTIDQNSPLLCGITVDWAAK